MKKETEQVDIRIFNRDETNEFLVIDRPFKPSYYAFLLLKQGFIKVRYKLTLHVLSANEVLLINPQVVYEILSISEQNDMMLIVISKNFQMRVPTRFSKLDTIHYFETSPAIHLTFAPNDFSNIWQLVEILKSKIGGDKSRFKDDLIHTLLASISYMLIERMGEIEALLGTLKSRREKLTIEFIDLLQIHFRQHHNLNFYAVRLKVSSKHLSETLKKVTGHTAREMINMALIREAKLLLADKDLKIGTISEMLNFSDQFSFSKFFKRMTSLSPMAYLARYSEEKKTYF